MFVSEHISKNIGRFQKGNPYSIESLYKFGSHTVVQKSLSRLAKEGKVEQVARGIYVRPKPLALVPNKMAKAPHKRIAETWAKSSDKVLVHQNPRIRLSLRFQT